MFSFILLLRFSKVRNDILIHIIYFIFIFILFLLIINKIINELDVFEIKYSKSIIDSLIYFKIQIAFIFILAILGKFIILQGRNIKFNDFILNSILFCLFIYLARSIVVYLLGVNEYYNFMIPNGEYVLFSYIVLLLLILFFSYSLDFLFETFAENNLFFSYFKNDFIYIILIFGFNFWFSLYMEDFKCRLEIFKEAIYEGRRVEFDYDRYFEDSQDEMDKNESLSN